ncbi:hypothetical protein OsJ_06809 [Oryza sativa Japonica Group]|uniref:Uncharacterized protein n=1 Tax=Oryza sativa subsp. japonica TaxID=39947 RepID=B9F038_ORYSJ|nr:hypothetical protein OsJ_06809 [Oryza sativa Japonica Group]
MPLRTFSAKETGPAATLLRVLEHPLAFSSSEGRTDANSSIGGRRRRWRDRSVGWAWLPPCCHQGGPAPCWRWATGGSNAGDGGCSGAGDDSDGDGSARTPAVEGRWAVGRGGGAAGNEARMLAVEVWLAEHGESGGAAGDSASTPTVKAWWAEDGEGAGAAGDG